MRNCGLARFSILPLCFCSILGQRGRKWMGQNWPTQRAAAGTQTSRRRGGFLQEAKSPKIRNNCFFVFWISLCNNKERAVTQTLIIHGDPPTPNPHPFHNDHYTLMCQMCLVCFSSAALAGFVVTE